MVTSNSKPPRDEDGRFTGHRRRRDRVVEGVRGRPYTSLAVATLAAGAGVAAFFLSRKGSDRPLLDWARKDETQTSKLAGTEAIVPPGAASPGVGDAATPAGADKADSAKSPRKDGIDLDAKSKSDIKTGAIAY